MPCGPCGDDMRGALPLCAPRCGGLRPPQPPWGGRSAPPPRVTFPSRGKSPKARQGLCPLESPWVSAKLWEPAEVRFEVLNSNPIELKAITIPYRPFRARCAALRLAPGYLLPLTQTDLPLWVGGQTGLVFFLWFHRGNTLCFQSVARQVPWLRGCLRV